MPYLEVIPRKDVSLVSISPYVDLIFLSIDETEHIANSFCNQSKDLLEQDIKFNASGRPISHKKRKKKHHEEWDVHSDGSAYNSFGKVDPMDMVNYAEYFDNEDLSDEGMPFQLIIITNRPIGCNRHHRHIFLQS